MSKAPATRHENETAQEHRGHLVARLAILEPGSSPAPPSEPEPERLAHRLTEAIENMPDAFFMVDREWRFTHINAAFEAHAQRDRETLLGRSLWEEFPAVVDTHVYTAYQEAVATRKPASLELYYPPLNEWFSINACPVSEGLAVYFRNITLKRKQEDQVREHAALLDKAQDAIIVTDLSRTIKYWNHSAERVFGWRTDEATGQNAAMLLHPSPTLISNAFDAVMRRGEWNGELEKRSKTGAFVIVESRWTLIHDNEGKPFSVLMIDTDVTEKRRLETEFLRAQRMETIGTLASGIAHDLNNTLTPILMGAAILKEEPLPQSAIDMLGTIEASAMRASELVRHVLGFAKGYGGSRIAVRLADIVKPVHKIIKDTFPKNISTIVRIPEPSWTVSADPTQLHQVLINLVVNARDAMPNGGTLTISLEQVVLSQRRCLDEGHKGVSAFFVIAVRDTGLGIPPEIRSRIFDPFFTTKEQGKGTGLGLATTQSIIKNHGGFIEFDSVIDKGTVFRVHLPADTEAEEPAQAPAKPIRRGCGELILLVEDESELRSLARQTLEQGGYKVITAEDGAEGLAFFAQHESAVSLLITDMAMPQLDGITMVRAALHRRPDLAVIASSGMSEAEQAAKAAAIGVRRFLPKPYTAQRLLEVVGDSFSS